MSVIGAAAVGATTGLFGSLVGNILNYRSQGKNHALAQEALDAQKAQQQWANEQYVESRDYDRAMQQQIFQREDTAIQRAVNDAQSAGFSPLAALGMPAGAGQVISSNSPPGNMVQNNQFATADMSGLGRDITSAVSLIQTALAQHSQQEVDILMQEVDLAHKADEAKLSRLHEAIQKDLDRTWDKRKHDAEMEEKLQSRLSSERTQRQLQKTLLRHQKDMQTSDQNFQKDMLKSQQEFMSSNANNQGSGRGLHDVFNDIIDVVAEGDGRMAKWLRDNQELLTLIIEGLEIGLGIGDNLANSQSQRDMNQSYIEKNLHK